MTLIAASVVTKNGKALVTRQFVTEMTRARLEGLLDAFPKLVGSEKSQRQHTFVETDSVRYVYQPIDSIYMVLVTTKKSNILEDLETLRLFSRVIPEFCRSNDESEILANAFELIFAFDEIVVLGYRENVNLAQIRTFTEMDSHEERVFNQIQIAQQRAAHNLMNEKVKEMKRAEKLKKGLRPGMGSASGMGSGNAHLMSSAASDFSIASSLDSSISKPKPVAKSAVTGGGKALKLGAKATTDDSFLQQLRSEGQNVVTDSLAKVNLKSEVASTVKRDAVHLKCSEKLTAKLSRDSTLESCEILGTMSLNVNDPRFQLVSVKIQNEDKSGAKLQVHPNLDKNTWQNSSLLKLKSSQKPFPVNVDVGVLKWRLELKDDDSLPITLNCWPDEAPDGCTVNIQYTLQRSDMQLNNVNVIIHLPPATTPVVTECEGTYEYARSSSQLLWSLPVIDGSNDSGSLQFSTSNGRSEDFFPVTVSYTSENLFCDLKALSVVTPENEESVDFSSEYVATADMTFN
jgi:hypothetical protein